MDSYSDCITVIFVLPQPQNVSGAFRSLLDNFTWDKGIFFLSIRKKNRCVYFMFIWNFKILKKDFFKSISKDFFQKSSSGIIFKFLHIFLWDELFLQEIFYKVLLITVRYSTRMFLPGIPTEKTFMQCLWLLNGFLLEFL